MFDVRMDRFLPVARRVIECCRSLALCSEEPAVITRRFLTPPMHEVHARLGAWMRDAGMSVAIDAAGNLRSRYPGSSAAPPLFIGSHLDTVPHAGAFDGVLGVALAIALVECLESRKLRFPIEVVGFSEEEGVRFGLPFIGSRALAGSLDPAALELRDADGLSLADAIRAFGLDPAGIPDARVTEALGYLEFHIEQGPLLESLGMPLAAVEKIVGQSRLEFLFEGQANHAGTTPMGFRRDALAAAAEWIAVVEGEAALAPAGMVCTVGRLDVVPGASNVIAGSARASLDVRHPDDTVRQEGVRRLADCARQIAVRRGLNASVHPQLDHPAVAMDASWTGKLERSITVAGLRAHRMSSGAGHDAMILAPRMPVAMLFLRSPGGISHHSDETVVQEDVAAALAVGWHFLEEL
jgi:allantoate deiminase